MKQGKSLSELAHELERQHEAKRDFITDTRNLELIIKQTEHKKREAEEEARVVMRLRDKGDFRLTDLFHRQLGRNTGIHANYYDKMREQAPDLLAVNVNHWLANEPKQRMMRCLDEDARALLSDSYRPLDNFDLAEIAIPILGDKGAEVQSTEITERRMYIKAIMPDMSSEVTTERGGRKVGDVVNWGVCVSNSEVGAGRLRIEEFLYTLACLNGMVVGRPLAKTHVGRAKGEGIEEVAEYYTDKTRKLDDAAFWSKVRDTLTNTFNPDRFQAAVESMNQAATLTISGDPVEAVEVTARQFRLTDDEKGGVLRHLVKGGDLSQWGLMGAITRTAEDVESYDRASKLEVIGGQLVELNKRDWKRIAEAA
jgi:hypothetical protein